MSSDRKVLRHAVEEIQFGFFSDDDVRSVSVKQLTSPMTFDAFNAPLPGGLYDRCLGPVEAHSMCETCGQTQRDCPGHLGHIELAVDVYHPLLFKILFKVLRSKCFSCHKLRLSTSKTRVLAVKLMLVDAGRGQEARWLEADLLGYMKDVDPAGEDPSSTMATKYKEAFLTKLEQELRGAPKAAWSGGHDRTLRRELVEEFIRDMAVPKTCQNCGAHSPKIRTDGSDKFFQVPLSEKARAANRASNVPVTSALQ
ncbi:unnamed protein product, partial [Discosporangium mesarthrocarpum]